MQEYEEVWLGTGGCIGRLFAMVKLGIGGRALYVLVRAVSVRPNMEPEVKEETGVVGCGIGW